VVSPHGGPRGGEVLHAPASEGKTPFLVIQVPPTDPAAGSARRVLMYGHMDKQPPMLPWAEGLGPSPGPRAPPLPPTPPLDPHHWVHGGSLPPSL